MKKKSAPTLTPQSVLKILFFILFFMAGYAFRDIGNERKPDAVKLISAIDNLRGDYGYSKSALEWITATIGLTPKTHLKHSVVRTAVEGIVVAKTREHSLLPILSKHYYVGTPGVYEFDGSITLASVSGETKNYHFSPKRMEFMKVTSLVNGRETPSTFADIAEGNVVEIEETVDLAKPNINDENLISLTVRILK